MNSDENSKMPVRRFLGKHLDRLTRAACVFCCAMAVTVLLSWWQQSTRAPQPESNLEDYSINSPLQTGKGFHLYDVKGFDDKSLLRRVSIDAVIVCIM